LINYYRNFGGCVLEHRNPLPPGRGEISADVIWGRNMKRGKRKREIMEENGRKRKKETKVKRVQSNQFKRAEKGKKVLMSKYLYP
jgi:hypothetical protein